MMKDKIHKTFLHENLTEDLFDATEKSQDLGVPHIAYLGISFFTKMVICCAPSEEEALDLVKEIVSDTFKDQQRVNWWVSGETGLHTIKTTTPCLALSLNQYGERYAKIK